ALVELTDAVAVEALLAHFKIGAGERIRGKLLDRELDRLGGSGKSPVAERRALVLAVMGRKQLGLETVVEPARLLLLRRLGSGRVLHDAGFPRAQNRLFGNGLSRSGTGHDDVFGF